jgi:hypothetical protein
MIDSQLRKQEEESNDSDEDSSRGIMTGRIFNTKLKNSILKYQPSFRGGDFSRDFSMRILQESVMTFIDLVNELELNYNPLLTIEKPSSKMTSNREINKKKKPMKSKIKYLAKDDSKPSITKQHVQQTENAAKDNTLTTNYSSRVQKKPNYHKVSPSLPEFNQNTIKFIDVNSPSIIKTNGNTHILINNNFFNFDTTGGGQTTKRVENDELIKSRLISNSNTRLNSHRYNTIIERFDSGILSPTQKLVSSSSKQKVLKYLYNNESNRDIISPATKVIAQRMNSPAINKLIHTDNGGTMKSKQEKVIQT